MEMKVQNLNRSSQRTRESIRKAYTELAGEKGELSRISVTELVRRAGINRTTFYTHYKDIYEIADEYQNEILNEVMVRTPSTKEEVLKFLDELYECFHDNEESYRMFLSSDNPRYFLCRLRNRIVEKILGASGLISKDDPWLTMKVEMYVDGMSEQMISYFRGRSSYSFDELKEGLLQFARDSF